MNTLSNEKNLQISKEDILYSHQLNSNDCFTLEKCIHEDSECLTLKKIIPDETVQSDVFQTLIETLRNSTNYDRPGICYISLFKFTC
jgi:hypothetical protein